MAYTCKHHAVKARSGFACKHCGIIMQKTSTLTAKNSNGMETVPVLFHYADEPNVPTLRTDAPTLLPANTANAVTIGQAFEEMSSNEN